VLGYDLVKAGSGLFGLSASLTSNEAAAPFADIRFLGLLEAARDSTEDQLRAIQEVWASEIAQLEKASLSSSLPWSLRPSSAHSNVLRK
jgi:hypothetical protein